MTKYLHDLTQGMHAPGADLSKNGKKKNPHGACW